jgi:hypothetical protein
MAERALATAFVNIVPGTQAVEQYLKGGLAGQAAGAGANAGASFGGKFKQGFSSLTRGLLAPMAASFGAVGFTQLLSGAVSEASNLNEQGAAVGQIFGKGAGSIQKFAEGAASSLGQSTSQILEASKSFGIFGKAAGLTGKNNAEFSSSLVSLATDLASFNNTSVDDAMMALRSGLAGETEPLRRFGILLNDSALRTQALKMGLIKNTKEALTPQNKVLATNALLFEQTKTQQGDFARTSGGLANQQRILTAEWTNAQAVLGSALIPGMTTLVGYLNASVIPAIKQFFTDFKDGKTPLNQIIDGVKNFVGYVAANWTWISTFGAAVLGVVVAVKGLSTAYAIYNGVLKAVAFAQAVMAARTALQNGATIAGTVAQWGFNAALLANPITWVVVGVTALIAALVWFFTQTKIGQKAWSSFTSFLGSSVKNIGKWFGDVFHGIGSAVKTVFSGIGGVVKGYFNAWIGLINHIINALNSLSIDIPDWVPVFGGQHWGVNIPTIPALADGGFVTKPTTALIGEAGPEVVTPLKDFKDMMGIGGSADRPIYADGVGLLGWIREEASGQAQLVFNQNLSKASRGAR